MTLPLWSARSALRADAVELVLAGRPNLAPRFSTERTEPSVPHLLGGKPSPNRRLRHADAGGDLAGRFVANGGIFLEFAQRCFRIRLNHCKERAKFDHALTANSSASYNPRWYFDNALTTLHTFDPQRRLSDLRGDRAQVRLHPQAHRRGDRCTADPAGTCAGHRSPLR
jgi:hypothetical protein